MRILGWLAVIVVFVVLGLFLVSNREPGRTIYIGGTIVTMDPNTPAAGGLGTDGDRIAIVGSEQEVRAWGGDDARVVDLEGHALLPGFIDAHGHYPGGGIYSVRTDLNSPPIGTMNSIDDIITRLQQEAAKTDAGDWVVGMGYDDTLLAEKRHPTREDLDKASLDHPIGIIHVSGHLAAVNSKALELVGYDEDTPDPPGGHLGRDPESGRLNGLLEENATAPVAMEAVTPSGLEILDIFRSGSQQYLEAGVTTAQSGYTSEAQADGMAWMSRLGLIPMRLVIWPGMEAADALLAGDWEFDSYDEDWLKLGAVKLIADGSIQGYTGYLSEPYHVPPGSDPNYRGYARIPREELIERVGRYHDAGMQVAIHGNGDASIDDILDALETAQQQSPRPDARPIIIHAQMTREDQLDRIAELDAIPSFFVLHTYYWGDRHRDIFMGPERAFRMSPTASAERRSIPYTLHADNPVVPMEPLRIIWSAVNRRSTSGQLIGNEQRITPMQALQGVTIRAARAHFEEADKGSLEAGKFADLVILSDSPLTVPPDEIDDITVLETIVGGKTVYQRDE